jgi:hypothetical protein
MKHLFLLFPIIFLLIGCKEDAPKYQASVPGIKEKVEAYQTFTLTANIDHLSTNQKEMLLLLFEVADIMDDLFWQQAWGDKTLLLNNIENKHLKKFAEINYGPWNRLNDNNPFIKGIGEKPAGARFYPENMTHKEFNNLNDHKKDNLYTIIERNAKGKLITIPYHEKWSHDLTCAADLLNQAAELAKNKEFRKYLRARAKAFTEGDYYESDMAWMNMKNNIIDFVAGPIETYEDGLYGAKAAFEAYILIKDMDWSARLARFTLLLPGLQSTLPVEEAYKSETPGNESDINVYDAVYYARDCNAGSKTIAINLPNDPDVQMQKGSRKLQLKNSMRAKFEHILKPISEIIVHPTQRKYIDFDAFFENTMFHEVAHGLGVKQTINDKGTVRKALKETASAIEESKADILGLHIVTRLAETGELDDKDLMTNYVTFMAGIFRSVRFGAANAHGKANMIRFNYFHEKNAFFRDPESGTYIIDFENMKQAMNELSKEILTIQGDGDYEKAKNMIKTMGVIKPDLATDLDRINNAGIPVDIDFKQGPEILGI